MRKICFFVLVILCLGSIGYAESPNMHITQITLGDGIVVFYIPADTLNGINVKKRIFTEYFEEPNQIRRLLLYNLSIEQYRAFIRQYEAEGYAEATVYRPSMGTMLNNELGTWMAHRRIGNAWMMVHYSAVKNPDMYDTLDVLEISLRYKEGVLEDEYRGMISFPIEQITINDLRDADFESIRVSDDMQMSIYTLPDSCIAVIQVLNLRAAVRFLCIDGEKVCVMSSMDRYEDRLVYACPLELTEAEAIRQGHAVTLEPAW